MTHHEFNELRHAAAGLPPEQMRQLRDELERRLAAFSAALPANADDDVPDPFMGLWRDYADEMDEIVADAYRKRKEEPWRTWPDDPTWVVSPSRNPSPTG